MELIETINWSTSEPHFTNFLKDPICYDYQDLCFRDLEGWFYMTVKMMSDH